MGQSIISFSGRRPIPERVQIGMKGEHNAEELVLVNLPEIADGQTETVEIVDRSGSVADALLLVDHKVLLTRTTMSMTGTLTAWAVVQNGTSVVWKSEKFFLEVKGLPSAEEMIEQQYPTAFEEAMGVTGANVTAANAAKTAAQASAAAAAASETAAGLSETAAAGSATNAANSAAAAETHKTAAAASAAAAANGATAAGLSADSAAYSAGEAANSEENAEAWANGTRDGEAVTSGDPAYQKNAKHWAGQADDRAEDAEAWSNGTRNGTAVASGDPAYNKNGQYYRQQAAGAMNNAHMFKRQAEAYAKGTMDGTPVPSGGVGYQDNAKHYAEQAAAQAAAAVAAITADAEGLPAGAEPTAVLDNGVLTIGVPKGDKGDTGRNGQDGISPTVTVTKSGSVVTISVTDGSGTTTATVSDGQDGEKGPTGATPNLTVGTVTTGAAGTQASANITGSAENPVLNLTIPRGSDGGGVPNGGTTGQALIKNSNTDQDVKWAAVDALPSGGYANQVLKKNNSNSAAEWGGYAVPTGGSANQVLAKNSGANGDLKWVNMSGGASTLGGLNNVMNYVDNAAYGDGLVYNGEQWTRGAPIHEAQITDDGNGIYHIDGVETVYYDIIEGYEVKVFDYSGENTVEYMVTAASEAYNEDAGENEYIVEILRYKANGKREKRIFTKRYVYDSDLGSYEPVYAEETPSGMVSNIEMVTQAMYDAKAQAGTLDAQTLYCIKEN